MTRTGSALTGSAELTFTPGKHASDLTLGFLGCTGLRDSLDCLGGGDFAPHLGIGIGTVMPCKSRPRPV